MTKHFLKTLVIFTGMIFLGLLGIFLISYFDQTREAPEDGQENVGQLQTGVDML